MKQVTIKVEILPSGRERYAVHCWLCASTQRVERVLVKRATGREVLLPVATPPLAAVTEDEDAALIKDEEEARRFAEAFNRAEASEPPKARQRKAAPSKPRRPPTPRPRARAGAKGGA